jgi:hypothetical protein
MPCARREVSTIPFRASRMPDFVRDDPVGGDWIQGRYC